MNTYYTRIYLFFIQKKIQIKTFTNLNLMTFCFKLRLTMIYRKVIIILFLGLLQFCGTTKQIDIYNPFPNKEVIIEQKDVSCADTYEIKLWYGFYGSYPINNVNVRELFPSPDYTYSIEQNATVGDKILSFFTGLFFSISRKTLLIKTCRPIARETESPDSRFSEEKSDLMDTEFSSKIEELEKEISFLKGKISGIETTVGWMNPPSQDIAQRGESKIPSFEANIGNSILKNSEQTSTEVTHHFLLFKTGSALVTKNELGKLQKLKALFNKPWSKILIIGSADTSGNFKSNLNLSWKRALEVKNLLVAEGISPQRILISGAGERKQTEESKVVEVTRRVDIYFVNGGVK